MLLATFAAYLECNKESAFKGTQRYVRDPGPQLHHGDLLVYIDKLENDLRGENQRRLIELEDAHLDLDDARRSRREMQQQLTATSQQLGQYNTDNESLKGLQPTLPPCLRPLAHKNRTEIPT
ncbi:hypothetical protein V490_00123 [Pseudogymnoascus sp. VKM F-3557]|nr:hypothetical protein V490_00123 [Pseudogymnoascus sp. VKM F-3557]